VRLGSTRAFWRCVLNPARGLHVVGAANEPLPRKREGATEHLVHGFRSNYPIAFVLHNSANYGLTTGQASALTWQGQSTNWSPNGMPEHTLPSMDLIFSLEPTFVASGFTGDIKLMTRILVAAIQHRGFAFVDMLQACSTFNHSATQSYLLASLGCARRYWLVLRRRWSEDADHLASVLDASTHQPDTGQRLLRSGVSLMGDHDNVAIMELLWGSPMVRVVRYGDLTTNVRVDIGHHFINLRLEPCYDHDPYRAHPTRVIRARLDL